MASMQPIPGVFAYLSEGGPRLAESFTAGMNAGSRVKGQKSDDARAKADQEFRADKEKYGRERDTVEDTFKREDIARRDQLNQQGLMQRYGQDIKYAADGSVDLPSSEAALRQRAIDAQVAQAYGQQSGLGMNGPWPEQVETNQMFPVGAAKGMAEKSRQDNSAQIAADRNTERLIEAAMRGGGTYDKPPKMSAVVEKDGVPGVDNDGHFTPLTGDSLRGYRQAHRPQTNAVPAVPTIRVTRGPNGEVIVTRP